MEYRKVKTTRWLWLMLFISWTADKWHCNYLAQKYQCEVADLLFKAPFYWLSVIFGVVDLTLGVLILRRATARQQMEPRRWEVLSASYCTQYGENRFTFSVDPDGLQKLATYWIIFISVGSLIVDFIKFIF